jgi:hypothetical protein
MKYLIFAIILATPAFAKAPEPKFYKTQKVTFEPGSFYKKVCTGKGEIISYQYNDFEDKGTFILSAGKYTYKYDVETPYNERVKGCPADFTVEEFKLKATK